MRGTPSASAPECIRSANVHSALLGTRLSTWTDTGSIFGQAEEAYADGLPTLIPPIGPAARVIGTAALLPACLVIAMYTTLAGVLSISLTEAMD